MGKKRDWTAYKQYYWNVYCTTVLLLCSPDEAIRILSTPMDGSLTSKKQLDKRISALGLCQDR